MRRPTLIDSGRLVSWTGGLDAGGLGPRTGMPRRAATTPLTCSIAMHESGAVCSADRNLHTPAARSRG